jgi:periplasmic protein TonB
MDLHNRDASYHRRLTMISIIVISALCVTVLVGQRYRHLDEMKMVGWKGEMQLLPEITIEPDVVLPDAAAAPKPREASEHISVPVAERSTFETDAPVKSAKREDEPDILDVQARGSALSEATHAPSPSSYSNTYVILHTVKPKYPEHERANGVEGSVTVELLIDTGGLVARANVLELIGPVSFQNSALEAVRQFEFQPPVENGVATTMWIKFVIKFRMNS